MAMLYRWVGHSKRLHVYDLVSLDCKFVSLFYFIELDTETAAKAIIAIAASYGLGQVSKGTEFPQLAFANLIPLIAIIAFLYSPHPAPKAK